MKPRVLPLLAPVLLALITAGCSAAPKVGDSLALQGTLVIKGNEPVTTPVLVRSDTEHWELQGVAPATASALQNSQVEARGRVTRAPGGTLLPALAVTNLQRR